MSDATTTDLYEVTMAVSCLREKMTGPATFSLFVRDLPAERGFLVAAGPESARDHLSGRRVGPQDVHAFAAALPPTARRIRAPVAPRALRAAARPRRPGPAPYRTADGGTRRTALDVRTRRVRAVPVRTELRRKRCRTPWNGRSASTSSRTGE